MKHLINTYLTDATFTIIRFIALSGILTLCALVVREIILNPNRISF